MPIEDYPSIDIIRQAFRYEDGKLYWTKRPRDHFRSHGAWRHFNSRYVGNEAGYLTNRGRIAVNLTVGTTRFSILRHKLVWALHEGEWCPVIDHINRDPSDDRISNLRPATVSLNNANSRIRKANTSGFKGVHWHANKWQAQIRVNGKGIYLGLFDDPALAHAAYMAAAREHFGEFACDE